MSALYQYHVLECLIILLNVGATYRKWHWGEGGGGQIGFSKCRVDSGVVLVPLAHFKLRNLALQCVLYILHVFICLSACICLLYVSFCFICPSFYPSVYSSICMYMYVDVSVWL